MKIARQLLACCPVRLMLFGMLLISATGVHAEARNVSSAGFLVHVQKTIAVTPRQAYEALGNVSKWWSSAHTWSGNAASLSLEMRAGGCFCERWASNSVVHGQVIVARQDEALSLQSSLGPLQQLAVNGVLTFSLKPIEGKTALTLTYRVVGNSDSGLDKLASAVDGVLNAQVGRLAALLETGQADNAARPAP